MLDHLSLGTTQLGRATAFYDAVLATLGVVRVWTFPDAVGYGLPGGGDRLALKQRPGAAPPGPGAHLAFTASSEHQVHAFHEAALASGGEDAGAPGPRPRYGPGYYAAFVVDPDGHHVEVVFHAPVEDLQVRTIETFLSLPVADMARAIRFYVEGVGASVAFASERWSSLTVAGVRIGLFPAPEHARGRTGLHFVVTDLRAAREMVEQAGGQLQGPEVEVAPGVVVVDVTDTEGNVVTLSRR